MTVISVIVGSTREGRFSEKPARWILQHLQKRDGVDARLLDLRDFTSKYATAGGCAYQGGVLGHWREYERAQGGPGLWIAQTEGAKFWLQVVTELKTRGVQDIFIACVDGLKGFPEAIEAVYPKAAVQLCIVHMVRNSLNYVSWKLQREVAPI
jgi:hypothetical protein